MESLIIETDHLIIKRKKDAKSVEDISFSIKKREVHEKKSIDQKVERMKYIEQNVFPWLKVKCVGMDRMEKMRFLKLKFGVEDPSKLSEIEISKMREVING